MTKKIDGGLLLTVRAGAAGHVTRRNRVCWVVNAAGRRSRVCWGVHAAAAGSRRLDWRVLRGR